VEYWSRLRPRDCFSEKERRTDHEDISEDTRRAIELCAQVRARCEFGDGVYVQQMVQTRLIKPW
jgi:hypothetical protein